MWLLTVHEVIQQEFIIARSSEAIKVAEMAFQTALEGLGDVDEQTYTDAVAEHPEPRVEN